MKVYIAASYPRKKEAKSLANRLAKGKIVSLWLTKDEGYDDLEGMGERAVRDLAAVEDADLLICLTDGEDQLTHGGRHTELGIAMALGKRIILIGPRESVFHYHPSIEYYEDIDAYTRSL